MQILFPDDLPEPEEDQPVDETPEEESGEIVPAPTASAVDGFMEMLHGIAEAIVEAEKEAEAELLELHDGEVFEDGQLSFGEDLNAYDNTAYTRVQDDYTSYRYNLSADSYAGTGGWMSSWHTGYKSAENALEGVHTHVATFIEDPSLISLEIVPDLERPSGDKHGDAVKASARNSPSMVAYDGYSFISESIARIDSSLYEKLGIGEAQQHYIVDCISQVLAIQSIPDPISVSYLQACSSTTSSFIIPNVLREITTELMRARGLPTLLERMPGWQKRVTAFRSVMFVGEPPNGDVPAAFLMYAVWERDVVETLEHEEAIEAIRKIEEILEQPLAFDNRMRTVRAGDYRDSRAHEIEKIIIDYITNFGPIGAIYSKLDETLRMLHDLKDNESYVDKGEIPADIAGRGKLVFDEVMPLIHDHNRTFCPNPAQSTVLRHQDFPDCPDRALLPEQKRNRIEFSRKCVFSLGKVSRFFACGSADSATSLKDLSSQIARTKELIGMFDPKVILANANKAAGDGMNREEGDNDSSGVNCTNHPELRTRGKGFSGDINREFLEKDSGSQKAVVIYDFTT
jgi:hypothetical protein